VRKRSRPSRTVSALPPRDLNAAPAPTLAFARSETPLSRAVPIVLPLLALGLLLLFGAFAVSTRRVPWPELAEPLYAHRVDLVVIGVGAIAVALVCLNVTVL
jgi:hypothetical protein